MSSSRHRWRDHRRWTCRWRLHVLHSKAQRALAALTDRRRDAERARDAERLVDEKRIVWDGAHDEVYVDGIGWRAQMHGGGRRVIACSRRGQGTLRARRWDGHGAVAEGRRRTIGRWTACWWGA